MVLKLLTVTSDIWNATDNGQTTLLGLLDLSAAFDTVDHDILLKRLQQSFGFGGTMLDWGTSFFTNRAQTVKFRDISASATQLDQGVPQDSVLGPLLFVLYTADVCDIAAAHGMNAHSYADDVQLYTHCLPRDQHAAVDRFTTCFAAIEQWMAVNRLKLNADKTEFMWLGSRQKLLQVTCHTLQLGGSSISASTSLWNLGVIFDPQMTLTQQANALLRSCLFQLRQLKTVCRLLPIEAAKTLVTAFVTSRLDYCYSVYYGATAAVNRKLQAVLNAAATLVTGKRKFDSISSELRDLHWLRVPQRVDYKLAAMVRRGLMSEGPGYLGDRITAVSSYEGRVHLRSANRGEILVPRCKTRTLARVNGRFLYQAHACGTHFARTLDV